MIDKSLLRDLVKSVIAEEVAAVRGAKAAPAPAIAEERIVIASDAPTSSCAGAAQRHPAGGR